MASKHVQPGFFDLDERYERPVRGGVRVAFAGGPPVRLGARFWCHVLDLRWPFVNARPAPLCARFPLRGEWAAGDDAMLAATLKNGRANYEHG